MKAEESIELKVGDEVTYEIIFDDGQTGTMTTVVYDIDSKAED